MNVTRSDPSPRGTIWARPSGITMAKQLQGLLQELDEEQFNNFKFFLRHSAPEPRIAWELLANASREQTVNLMLRCHSHNSQELTLQLLELICRLDLAQCFQPPKDRAASSGASGAAAKGHEPALAPAGRLRLVSQSQLMNLASCMGRKWRQIGIQFLGLEYHQLEQVEEDHRGDLVLQAFGMLLEWRQQQGRAATAAHLHSILSAQKVPLQPEALDCLLKPGQG
ncbi:uncharacterized protein LOC106722580 [Alligator sinensis]|uniref:Uncharacterized protein LOC106722580 n=1 Tax=Alligator sinensis TaxID=38654 RepID=A0A1U8DN30_ALLSI|nr:uncharacterized protein LOC106722580 [Alligator sinensis]